MPQHHKHKGVRQRPGRVYLILLLLLLAGCAAPTPAGPQPTLLPTADAVMMAALLSRTPAGSAEARPGQPPVTPTVTTTTAVIAVTARCFGILDGSARFVVVDAGSLTGETGRIRRQPHRLV